MPDIKKGHLVRFDVLRILAALMVIGEHFDTELPRYLSFDHYPQPMSNGLGTYFFDGSLAVAIFFLLSGFFSYKTLIKDGFSVRTYITKRLKRLLVPFWIAWVIGFIFNLVLRNTVIVANGKCLILTLFGLDRYVPTFFPIKTWGIVGEWYTGAIIVVTLIWPLMRSLMRSKFWLGIAGILVLQGCVGLLLPEQSIAIQYWRSPLVSLTSFTIGVGAARFVRLDIWRRGRSYVKIASALVIALLGSIIHGIGPIIGVYSFQVIALGYFLLADGVGEVLGRIRKPKTMLVGERLIAYVASSSYQFYLFQHLAIYLVLGKAAQAFGKTTVYPVTILLLFGSCVLIAYFLAKTCILAERRLGDVAGGVH